ncbi:MAG TPA: AAA family ATPase [Steroidobacteraceae bacterium]|nr:AAA family ATPase [Steroidobacteraceae bacterium]
MRDSAQSFGYWLRRRRKALDLTQEALAEQVSCSGFAIRKIEADERKPSLPLARRLAVALAVPEEERRAFLDAARAIRSIGRLPLAGSPVDPAGKAAVEFAGDAATYAKNEVAPFVGRRGEYELLVGLIGALAAGRGNTVLIEGEPGIGKSRLIRELVRHAETLGMSALATNCYEIERAIPYQPVIDLVARALGRASPFELGKLAPVSLAELSALAPEVAERYPQLPALSRDFPEARQARLSHAVGQLFEAVRHDRPLILVVDDIQWADEASLRVFHYLARHAADQPTLMIYAYRDDDLASDERLALFIESLHRESNAHRIALDRLRFLDAKALVGSFHDAKPETPGLATHLFLETEGNPFFLTSILQSLSDGETRWDGLGGNGPGLLPDALRAAVRVRLAHVPKEIRPTLETAAVLGRRFDFDTLREATNQSEGEVLDSVEALVKRRFLREETEDGVYDFSHDKVREVVYRDIGGARRRVLHRSVAEAIERCVDGESHERDARLSEHYERAQEWSKALRYLILTAERSLALFAMRDAFHWLDRAVALSETHPDALDRQGRLALYELRGTARAQAGLTDGAVADMRRVIDSAHAAGDTEKARDALIQLGMAYRRADLYEQATACLNEALAETRKMQDERQAADILYHLGTVAWSTGLNGQAIGAHEEAVAICERMNLVDVIAVQAYHGRGEAHYANAQPNEAIACFNRSLGLARQIGDKSYESENLMMIGHACVGSKGLGDYARAMVNFDAALEIANTADLQWHMGPTLLGLDHVRACTGKYGEAWMGIQKTLHWLEGLKQVRYQLIAYDFLGELLLDVNLPERVIETMERALLLAQTAGINFWRAALEAHLAVARMRRGSADGAASLEAALERTRGASERYLTIRCLDALAELAIAGGDTRRCHAFASELLALAESNGLREVEARARRWRGEAFLADRGYAEALTELSCAAAQAQDIGRVRLRMDLELALARLHAARDQQHEAGLHGRNADEIRKMIERSLVSSELRAQLQPGLAH